MMKNMDFALAKSKHLAWRTLLRSFLDGKGGLSEAQVVSCRDCDLGKWLYREGLKKYSGVTEMKELESVHSSMHDTVKRVFETKKAGKSSEAEKAFKEMEQLSGKVVDLLSAVEGKVVLA
jgi:methyl-accepting chemotaxis protein